MFTGIVEEVGRVKEIRRGSRSAVLMISARKVLEDTRIGDSIAVNGICLTVVELGDAWFAADVMPESLGRSALSGLQKGSAVNLERAMSANGRFGGHMVTGHVDGVGTILRIRKDDNAVLYRIQCKPALLHFMVEKGSVTVDGVSLTITEVAGEHFSVSLIPHTVAQTCFRERKEGDPVNLETDILGKYVERLLWDGGSGSELLKSPWQGKSGNPESKRGGITKAFLSEYGF